MLAQAVLLLALASQGSDHRYPRRSVRSPQAALLARFRADPSGFNPAFGNYDPASRVRPAFHSPPHMARAAGAEAQKVGLERAKQHEDRMARNRMPVVSQVQMRLDP